MVAGPTAVGKSAFALRAALELGGEIVSADSRQAYRGLDIGTAKPTARERALVPHHLVDILEPDEEFGLVPFLDLARRVVADIAARGRLPVIVGGSSQYLFALMEGWSPDRVPPDPALRESLGRRAEADGGAQLHRELADIDPEAAGRIDPRNTRRVIRALEVRARSSASQDAPVPPPGLAGGALCVGLTLPRAELHRRIDDRVDRMMEAGWLREVEALVGRGYGPELPSMSSIGYGELAGHMAGDATLEESIRRIKHRSHRLARGQYVWLRRARWLEWFEADEAGIQLAMARVGERLGARC